MNPNKHIPPKAAQGFLTWFLRDDYAEEVQGDLDEQFDAKLSMTSAFRAKLNYWFQVINYLRPFAIMKSSTQIIFFAMYRNYFKIGWRNLTISKGYSFINISGLAVGMAVAMLIGLWVWDELSFNKNHDHYSTIAKVMTQDGEYTNGVLTTGMGSLLNTDYSNHFERVTMVRGGIEERAIAVEDNSFLQNGYFMQAEGPEIFSFNMLKGTQQGLKDMNSILLSGSLANKLFKDKNPLGQVVRMDDRWDLIVTGVYEDLPINSEFSEASYFAPLDLYLNGWSSLDVWNNYNMYVFVQIQPHTNFTAVSSMIKHAMSPHLNENASAQEIFLHPMSKWHLYSEFENGNYVTSKNLTFLWFMSIIGVFVLILACINFMNLSTARSEKRAKEVGIRKAIGSVRGQLISQFLTESFLVVAFSFVMSVILVILILPWFNHVAGKELQILWTNPIFWLSGICFILFTSLLAGSYPAFYLSSFKPLKVLKGSFRSGAGTVIPRKILVVLQFTVSISLIIGTIIIYQQIQFTKNRPVGYTREALLTLPVRSPEFSEKYNALRNSLKNSGLIDEIALANYPITSWKGWNGGFDWQGRDPNFQESFNIMRVTPEYGRTVGLEFIEGRDFTRELAIDKDAIIINESALELMGIDNPIGKTISRPPKGKLFTIIGVSKDMVKGSPFEPAFPSIIFNSDNNLSEMFIRLSPQVSASEALPKIDKLFHSHLPFVPFDYKFADDVYNRKFAAEERIGDLAGFFTVLAILISCMGLFGLASFVAEQRTKEIGIRKVMGASVTNLWGMLSKDFLILIVISCLIAIPVSYILLSDWLQNYEYRTSISVWIFAASGIGMLVITLATVSFQSIKAAFMNPVDCLRNE